MHRTNLVLWLGLVGLSGCGREAPDRPSPRVEAPPVEAAPTTPRTWGVQRGRACTQWGPAASMVATPRRVFGCGGAIFDAEDASLVGLRDPEGTLLAARGDRALVLRHVGEHTALFVEDERGARRIEGVVDVDAVAMRDERTAFVSTYTGSRTIDLARGTSAPSSLGASCAHATAVGFTASGEPICAVRCGAATCVRTTGSPQRELPLFAQVAFDEGGRLFGLAGERLSMVDGDATRSITVEDISEILAVADRRAIVASESATELVQFAGSPAREVIHPRAADGAGFVDADRLVLLTTTFSPDHLWLARGAHFAPGAPPPTPRGFNAWRPSFDDGHTVFVDGESGQVGRRVDDVAFFESNLTYAVVARSDASEFAAFADDDARWAQRVAARYLEQGEERWARAWRDASGRRFFRGHAYIGGCERTHFDVRVEERGRSLERWTIMSSDGDTERERTDVVERALGAIPATAISVRDLESSYPGDPSIGRVASP